MEKRVEELNKLKEYIESIDKETTLLLQNFQWDHKNLIESPRMVTCKYVTAHRMPVGTIDSHERQCYLTQLGYSKHCILLPDAVDPNANTIVKLSKQDILQIIESACNSNPILKRGAREGAGCEDAPPLSAGRLQLAYSAAARRAIHDAVVAAASACHDLTHLALISSNDKPHGSKEPMTELVKTRQEIMAELRDMKRRRTKYRQAPKTRNYSHVLRDVIKSQMELYAEAKGICINTEYGIKNFTSINDTIPNVSPCREDSHITSKQKQLSLENDNCSESPKRSRNRSNSKDRHCRMDEDKRRHRDRSNDSSLHKEKHRYDSRERRRHDYGLKSHHTYDYGSTRLTSSQDNRSDLSNSYKKYKRHDEYESSDYRNKQTSYYKDYDTHDKNSHDRNGSRDKNKHGYTVRHERHRVSTETDSEKNTERRKEEKYTKIDQQVSRTKTVCYDTRNMKEDYNKTQRHRPQDYRYE